MENTVEQTERERLIEGLREAVGTLYRCRYSEVPLANKLDQLLKEITGKSNGDIILERAVSWPYLPKVGPALEPSTGDG